MDFITFLFLIFYFIVMDKKTPMCSFLMEATEKRVVVEDLKVCNVEKKSYEYIFKYIRDNTDFDQNLGRLFSPDLPKLNL